MSSTHSDNGITVTREGTNSPAAGSTRTGGGMAGRPTMAAPGGWRGAISGYAERGIDAVAGATGRGEDPRVGKAKDFVRSKPLAVAAAAGVIGLALLNTLRGAGRRGA